jgi:ATP-dependent RNA helicase RhlB
MVARSNAAHAGWDISQFPVEPVEGKTRFQDLEIAGEIMHAIADLGFKFCTPIQAQVLPHTLKGRDAFGKAQTGTGKTAAFLITMLNHFMSKPGRADRKPGTPRALILAPTRELVIQIHKDATALMPYTGLSVAAVFGGMDYEKQKRQLRGQVIDIVAATPGRLLDFKKRGDLDLSEVEVLVIDEADRMLDMGFIPDVRTIVHSTPNKDRRQTLFFSATLTPDVQRLATQWTRDPVSIEIEPEQVATDTVDQVLYIVTADEKFALLYNILKRENAQRVIVFVNRRDHAEHLLARLSAYHINGALLSGAVPQEKRLRVLEMFREGKVQVLVATDVAGRGIHVDGVSHVINFNLPFDAEDYVHRIGRTGRAGKLGTSISFACEDDSFYIPAIEKYLGMTLTCSHPEDSWLVLPPPPEGQVDPGPRARPARSPYAGGRGGPRRRGGPGGGGRGRPPGRR